MTTIRVSPESKAMLERIKKKKRKKNLDDVLKMLIAEHDASENAPIKESKPSKMETPQDKDAWTKDPARKLDRYGMVYCYFNGGIWVFRSKCDVCKNWNCEVKKKKQEVKP
jgi:hypothetical protein